MRTVAHKSSRQHSQSVPGSTGKTNSDRIRTRSNLLFRRAADGGQRSESHFDRLLLSHHVRTACRKHKPAGLCKGHATTESGDLSRTQLDHVGRLLNHVKGVPSLAGDYNLFYAKYQMHAGNLNEAVSAFDAMTSTAGESISTFDGKNRLIDGPRFGAVIALSQTGKTEVLASACDRF